MCSLLFIGSHVCLAHVDFISCGCPFRYNTLAGVLISIVGTIIAVVGALLVLAAVGNIQRTGFFDIAGCLACSAVWSCTALRCCIFIRG